MTVEREFLRRIATGSVGYTYAQSAFVSQQLRLTGPGTARKSKPSREPLKGLVIAKIKFNEDVLRTLISP